MAGQGQQGLEYGNNATANATTNATNDNKRIEVRNVRKAPRREGGEGNRCRLF